MIFDNTPKCTICRYKYNMCIYDREEPIKYTQAHLIYVFSIKSHF